MRLGREQSTGVVEESRSESPAGRRLVSDRPGERERVDALDGQGLERPAVAEEDAALHVG